MRKPNQQKISRNQVIYLDGVYSLLFLCASIDYCYYIHYIRNKQQTNSLAFCFIFLLVVFFFSFSHFHLIHLMCIKFTCVTFMIDLVDYFLEMALFSFRLIFRACLCYKPYTWNVHRIHRIYYCVHALKIHSILIMSYAWCIPFYVQLCAFLRFFQLFFSLLSQYTSMKYSQYTDAAFYLYEQLFCVQSHDKSQWYCLINTIALKPFFVGFMVMEAMNAIDLMKSIDLIKPAI